MPKKPLRPRMKPIHRCCQDTQWVIRTLDPCSDGRRILRTSSNLQEAFSRASRPRRLWLLRNLSKYPDLSEPSKVPPPFHFGYGGGVRMNLFVRTDTKIHRLPVTWETCVLLLALAQQRGRNPSTNP